MLMSNQIKGFFDYQYLWKESIIVLDFWRIDSYQKKVASTVTTAGLLCQT